MEGPCIRRFPRIALDKPVELRSGNTVILLESARGNLSAGGLFVTTQAPASGEVQLRIQGSQAFEVRGIIRHFLDNGATGVGIEFSDLSEPARKDLDQFIAELTRDGAPAA